ncbi:MAG: xylulokinase [Puniceicoccaceae bacterium]
MPYYLGIDASTQSVSAIVLDAAEGAIVAEASVNFGAELPHYDAPNGFISGGELGEVHADPLMWLEGLERCIERLKEKSVDLGKVIALSGAGQQHGTVYLTQKGLQTLQVLDPARQLVDQWEGAFSRSTSPIWMDVSTGAECREIESALGGAAAVCRRTGSVAIERFSGPQIRKFAKRQPEAWKATARVHLVSSFLSSVLLGGDAPTEPGDAAGMNLLSLTEGSWDAQMLAATAPGLEERLPNLVPSQTCLGTISDWWVQRHGFSPGAKVWACTGDNPSSLVGMLAAEAGTAVISLGTSDTFFAAMEAPRTDPAGSGHVFGNPLGGWMTLQCFINGSLAREKVRDAGGWNWEEFTHLLDAVEAGAEGSRMLPFFGPEISPRLDVEAPLVAGPIADGWAGSRLSPRACVEGQFLNMRRATAWMQLNLDRLYLTGGAAANDRIASIAADVFGVEVARLAVTGSVALGAALRALRGEDELGFDRVAAALRRRLAKSRITPNLELRNLYEEAGRGIEQLLEI